MFWLSTLSLVVGGLLALRFTIFALVPATFVIVVIAIAVGEARPTDIWSVLFTSIVASVSIQVGYFLGMYGLNAFLEREPSSRDAVVVTPDRHGETRQLPSVKSSTAGNTIAATVASDHADENERRQSVSHAARPAHQT